MSESSARAGLRGVVEEVKGRAKEGWAGLTGNKREAASDEAEARQRQAAAQREAAIDEAEAQLAGARPPPTRPSSAANRPATDLRAR